MLQLVMRLALVVVVVCVVPVALIRAQPVDDSEIRAFLALPERCPAPCFMGIRPGVTRGHEALAILASQSAIVDQVDAYSIRFRASHPRSLVDDRHTSTIRLQSNRVFSMNIQTEITLGELWAAYGQADWGLRTYQTGSSSIYYTIGYDDTSLGFRFAVLHETPHIRFEDVLKAKVILQLGTDRQQHAIMEPALWRFASRDLSWLGE